MASAPLNGRLEGGAGPPRPPAPKIRATVRGGWGTLSPVDEAAEALLRAVADTARSCGDAYTVRIDGRRVEIEPTARDGFGVVVEVDDDGVSVTLGHAGSGPGDASREASGLGPGDDLGPGWTRRFSREDDPEEDHDALALAHDLVAAALWGRARLRVEVLGGTPWRTTVCFGAPGRWLTFERQGGGLRVPWRRPVVHERRNCGRPPRPIDDAKLRPLPWAPWAGMRGESASEPEPQPMPIDGELDLHSFSPKDVKALVLETIEQHRAQGILALRIVHGKGIGHLRRTVHAILERHPAVVSFRLGGHGAGSWGATLVDLRPLGEDEERC